MIKGEKVLHTQTNAENHEYPNILLIMTDQQRFDTIGALGNPYIKTPALDRLVKEGTSFTSAYTASPVCVPSRCSMMYGKYPLFTGCLENNFSMPDENEQQSFVDHLTSHGYRTHAIGKRHFTPDPQAKRGFQTLESQEELVSRIEDDDYLQYLKENGCAEVYEPFGVRGEAYYVPQIAPLTQQHHPTQWVGDRSVKWIEEYNDESSPFMLFSSFVHPHPPFSPPSPWHKLYRSMNMPESLHLENNEDFWVYTNWIQNRYKGKDQGTDRRLQKLIKAYYWASISFVDYQISRMIEVLEKKHLLDSTLIIFTSDHGEFLGDYGAYGKRHFLNAAAQIPLICRHPSSFKMNATCETPVSLVDILPTTLHSCTDDYNSLADGVALQDIANNKSQRERVFGHYQQADSALYMSQSKSYSYIYSASDDKEFLFDRKRDPQQCKNLAYNLMYKHIVTSERSKLIDHLSQYESSSEICTETAFITQPAKKPYIDPDQGLIIQDPECFLDNFYIEGYSPLSLKNLDETKADFDPLNA